MPGRSIDDAIINYGDLDTLASWVYLEANLNAGHSFTIQLLPAITDDVFLHAKIISVESFEIGGQVFERCVECIYAIDFGIGREVGSDRYYRAEHYGVVNGVLSCVARAMGQVLIHGRPIVLDSLFALRDWLVS